MIAGIFEVSFTKLSLNKLYPLAISRGTMSSSENLFVTISDCTHTGIGEMSPATGKAWTAENGETQLAAYLSQSKLFAEPLISPHHIWQEMIDARIDPPSVAALDMAIWDLIAKRGGMPLFALLGLRRRAVPTSVTIGLNPPEVTKERVPDILRRTGAKCLKIKLGSPDGREFDKAHFTAAAEASAPFEVSLRVDANGGWTVDEAIAMNKWLAERGVVYVEQPLVEGAEADLPLIFKDRPLPIYVDESCRFSQDIPKFADSVDGVNLKLMKCGGITEALRIIATARAHSLGTMIGCMSESSISIAAGAAMSDLFDHIDLDSHLNLNPDPAVGAPIEDGKVLPLIVPGHGASLKPEVLTHA